MARRNQKSLESLARELAHRSEELSGFERLLFWTRLLWLPDPARALTAMGSSANPTDRDYFLSATTAGHATARLAVTVDLAIASFDDASSAVAAVSDSALGRRIFDWHDWPSFDMELQSWLTALPKPELRRDLKRRMAAGLPESTAHRIAQHAACGSLEKCAVDRLCN